jgi:hypothetical protein
MDLRGSSLKLSLPSPPTDPVTLSSAPGRYLIKSGRHAADALMSGLFSGLPPLQRRLVLLLSAVVGLCLLARLAITILLLVWGLR